MIIALSSPGNYMVLNGVRAMFERPQHSTYDAHWKVVPTSVQLSDSVLGITGVLKLNESCNERIGSGTKRSS